MVKYTFKPQHQNLYSPYRSLYITCGINKENLFKITSFTSLWSFPWFSWRLCFIQQWYCLEKLAASHSQRFEADLIAKYEIYSYIHLYIYIYIYIYIIFSEVSVNQKLRVSLQSIFSNWVSSDVLYDLFGILFSALYFKSRIFFHMISYQNGISFLSINII